jgi:hypothetical protein
VQVAVQCSPKHGERADDHDGAAVPQPGSPLAERKQSFDGVFHKFLALVAPGPLRSPVIVYGIAENVRSTIIGRAGDTMP